MGRLIERNGIHLRNIEYSPLPSQTNFHNSTLRFKGFSGPIGSGKSQALCHEAIRLAYMNPGRTGLIGAPTYPMLRDATQAAFVEILEANHIPFSSCKSENVMRLSETGSKILFRSMDDFERLRGTNIAWFGLDELTYTHEEAWLRMEGRLRDPKASRLCGFAVWTPKGYDWVYRRFIDSKTARYGVTRAKAFENKHVLIKIPDYYERLKGSYDDAFFQQEVLGEYLSVGSTRVYSEFEHGVHVRDLQPIPNRPICWALDFNVDPLCSVIVQMNGNTIHVLDEIVLNRASTQEACEEFSRRYGSHAAGYSIYGDASGQANSTKGSSDYDIVVQHFKTRRESMRYEIPSYNPRVRERVTVVNAKFKQTFDGPQLIIDPKCKELIKDFEQVSYKADSNDVDKNKDRRRTHASDALGYLIYFECKPVLKIGERNRALL